MSNNTQDPRRISLPPVDTSMRLYRGLTIAEAKFFAPAAVVVAVSAIVGLLGPLLYGVVGALAGVVLLVVGAIGYSRDRWWTSAPDRCRSACRYLRRRRVLPWTPANSTDGIHGIKRIDSRGIVHRSSGEVTALVRIHPTNTAMHTAEETDALSRQFGQALDEGIGDFDIDFYSTTRPPNDRSLTEPYRDAETDGVAAEYLESVAAWTCTEDAPRWGAHDWRHYAVVRADRFDTRREEGILSSYIPGVSTARRGEHESIEAAVESKATQAADALETIDGIRARPTGPSETAGVISRYWRGAGHEYRAGFAPDVLDQDGPNLVVEDQLVRTIWIAEWPTDPDALFLRDLYQSRGVNLDVKLSLRAQDKERTKAELDEKTAQVDAETQERQEEGDITAIDSEEDVDYYLHMRRLLKETTTQPWQISGYVTVRCTDSDALAYVRDLVGEFDGLEMAKEAALSDACSDATRLLERAPANCTPVQSRVKQVEAFKACAPTHPDDFADRATNEVRTLVPGGLVGGAFPFVGSVPQEPDGFDFGRSTSTMQTVRADPFARGSAPHGLVLGKSRSGKTFAVSRAILRWYAQSPDHNLIVCDTQGGFHGLTRLLDGEHIVVDGQQSINPLDIQPIPEYQRDLVGGQSDPYRRTVETATQFLLGILRAQGVDSPGEYTATVEHGLEETYGQAGIYPDDLDSHARASPTVGDLLETFGEMLDSPGHYTHSGHRAEAEAKVDRVAGLLDKLSGFHDGGRYSHLVAETGEGLLADDVDMAYLDCQELQGSADAEKSVTLQLLMGQVSQFCKRAAGETVFVLDEAHVLLHSETMVQWLQKVAREYARYDASLLFVSQSPREFLEQSGDRESAQENQRQTIVDQCSFKHLFYTDLSDTDEDDRSACLRQLGLNEVQDHFVRHQAARGKDSDYSESLVSFTDYRGWFPTRIESGPFERHILEYEPSENGNFEEYLEGFDA